MRQGQVYLNGEFINAEKAKVSVFDRGFLLGDGVYEVIPVYNGRSFRLAGHLERLQQSLDGIRLDNPMSDSAWENVINEIINRNGAGHQSLYLQVTRGAAPRDHIFPENVEPTVFVMSNPLQVVPDTYKKNGIKAITVDDIRWQNCHIKAISLLPNILLKQQAQDAGAQEALLIKEGFLTEGSVSNAYAVIDGKVYTAPKDEKVLPGITRDLVLELAAKADIEVIEQAVPAEQLQQAEEVWVSSSTKDVLPVTQLDGAPVNDGKPGPLWKQIDALYQQFKQQGELMSEEETLLEFPCDYDIKAMGLTRIELDVTIVNIIRKYVDDIVEGAVTSKQSSGGKYTSVTVAIRATSKTQLDAIYQELTSHELIKYVL